MKKSDACMIEEKVAQYLKLPYHIEIMRDEDEENPGYVARVAELPGCITQGDTFEELGEMIEDAMRGWIEVALRDGVPIPDPAPEEAYSGKFVARVPRSLHRQLALAAEREGVSLNQLLNVILAGALGQGLPPAAYSAQEGRPSLSVAEKPSAAQGYASRKRGGGRKKGMEDER